MFKTCICNKERKKGLQPYDLQKNSECDKIQKNKEVNKMKTLSNISNKIKILILVLYSALAIVVAFLIVDRATQVDLFEEYTNTPYDDTVKVNFQLKEVRKSSVENNADYESTTYELYGSVAKDTGNEKAKETKISNIRFYVSGITTSGKIVFDEALRDGSISETSTYPYRTSSNLAANNTFVKKVTVTEGTAEKTMKEPAQIYFRVTYTATEKNCPAQDKEILYSTSITNIDKIDFSSFEERQVQNGKIVNEADPFDLLISKKLNNENTTSSTNVKKDYIRTQFDLNNPNLAGKTVKDAKIEVFGKVNNDNKDKENDFADYLRVVAYYGTILSVTYIETAIDESYDISDLFVVAHIEYTDGTNYNTQFKISIANLNAY